MANQQIGGFLGLTQKSPADAKIAEVTADGANTVTVATTDLHKFRLGQNIVFRVKSTGAGFGTTSRTVTGLTAAGVITYSGADIAVVPGTHAIYNGDIPYATSSVAMDQKVNLNGGTSAERGFFDPSYLTIQDLKAELFSLDSTSYTVARMYSMTKNDLVYALRTKRAGNGLL